MARDSENVEHQIEEQGDVPQIPEDHMLRCPSDDCPGDDDDFSIVIEHELQRKQDVEAQEAENLWKESSISVIMCNNCRTVMLGDNVAGGMANNQSEEG